jgi:hypothetical protein
LAAACWWSRCAPGPSSTGAPRCAPPLPGAASAQPRRRRRRRRRRQCFDLHCDRGSASRPKCGLTFSPDREACYEFKGLPAEQQLSIYPVPGQDQDVVYWQGFMDLPPTRMRQVISEAQFAREHPPEDRRASLPLHWCPQSCSFHGVCYKDRHHDDKPFCTCYHVGPRHLAWPAASAGLAWRGPARPGLARPGLACQLALLLASLLLWRRGLEGSR